MINYNLININKTIKFVLFFGLIILFIVLTNIITDLTSIIMLCAYISVVYYILDIYYPNCGININFNELK